jgi:hypothetical protein
MTQYVTKALGDLAALEAKLRQDFPAEREAVGVPEAS